MSNSRQYTMDLCPVCGSGYVLKGAIYCSKKCRIAAYNYRKRLMLVKRYLVGLGFIWQYVGGSPQIYIRLPVEIHHGYPVSLHSFYFPDPGNPIPLLNADRFWEAFEVQLGSMVGSYVRWMFETGRYKPELARELMQSIVRVALFDHASHYHCYLCDRDHITTGVIWGEGDDQGRCVDCGKIAPVAAPF